MGSWELESFPYLVKSLFDQWLFNCDVILCFATNKMVILFDICLYLDTLRNDRQILYKEQINRQMSMSIKISNSLCQWFHLTNAWYNLKINLFPITNLLENHIL